MFQVFLLMEKQEMSMKAKCASPELMHGREVWDLDYSGCSGLNCTLAAEPVEWT